MFNGSPGSAQHDRMRFCALVSVKVKVSVFVVAVVGSSSAAYEICICDACA